MCKPVRFWIAVAALNGLIAVAAGAYGAHGLSDTPDYLVKSFNIGDQYQMWHALALLGVAWLVERTDGAWLPRLAGVAFLLGIILFSGSLYYFGITGSLPSEGSAPVGGFLLMAGWILVGLSALKGDATRKRSPVMSSPDEQD